MRHLYDNKELRNYSICQEKKKEERQALWLRFADLALPDALEGFPIKWPRLHQKDIHLEHGCQMDQIIRL